MSDFDEIRRVVMEDSALMAAFTGAENEAELFGLTIELGRQRGVVLTAAELTEIVRANRRAWFERWLLQ